MVLKEPFIACKFLTVSYNFIGKGTELQIGIKIKLDEIHSANLSILMSVGQLNNEFSVSI